MILSFEDLLKERDVKYHTDNFIIKTLGFRPTQSEQIMRNNYNKAVSVKLEAEFNGVASAPISFKNVYENLFPNDETFLNYLDSRKNLINYIISRKAKSEDKVLEIRELALDEMREILTLSNLDDETGKPDHKVLNLKVNIFKHLDTAFNKSNININITKTKTKNNNIITLGPDKIRRIMDVTPVSSSITQHGPVQVDYNTNKIKIEYDEDGKEIKPIPDFYLEPPAPSVNSSNIINTGSNNNNDDELTKRLEELLEKEKVLTNSVNKANKA